MILQKPRLALGTSGLYEHGFKLRDQLVDTNLHELPWVEQLLHYRGVVTLLDSNMPWVPHSAGANDHTLTLQFQNCLINVSRGQVRRSFRE